jgi:glucose-6-phosphate 1-dehydrogenase
MSPRVFVEATPSQFPQAGGEPDGHGDPCTLVVLGAAGDLARRKLLPAVYELARRKLLDPQFALLGVGLESYDDAKYRELAREAILGSEECQSRPPDADAVAWLIERTYYLSGDLTSAALYAAMVERLGPIEAGRASEKRNRMFYLAVPPSIMEPIVNLLASSGAAPRTEAPEARPWARVVLEKPFGRSLATARALNHVVLGVFGEHQIYRIDHYLAKETVQNILVFRTANLIFEPLWNHQYIASVQITAAETVGVEKRGKYYEEAGVVRDMVQNHLFQLLALTTMELPVGMSADAVRDEKVKALRAVAPLVPEGGEPAAVRAQYAAGALKDVALPGYREEPNVAPGSVTPTYVALRVAIENWRWQGVPIYLRSGKRLAKRVSEIAIEFRTPPHLHIDGAGGDGPPLAPNVLVLRVQPDEGVALRFQVKVPGAALALTPEIEVSAVDMDFQYASAFGTEPHPAYETLLLDCMVGDATLFARSDEVEAAWTLIDPLLEHWESKPPATIATYPAGSWGPAEADQMLVSDGFRWRQP